MRVVSWLSSGVLSGASTMYDGEHLMRCVRQNVGDWTFQDAYDRTGRILNITVSPAEGRDYPRLLNYLTSPHVYIYSAVCASCALPGIFPTVSLVAKGRDGKPMPYVTEGLRFSDGSLQVRHSPSFCSVRLLQLFCSPSTLLFAFNN
jgi:TAG lipase/steryl ester hydrolase/phospholipase A2/LPA acyltransferase